MRPAARSSRTTTILLLLLCVTVALPLVFLAIVPLDLRTSIANEEFLGEISGIVKTLSLKSAGVLKLNSIQQDIGEGLKEPAGVVYEDQKGISSDSSVRVADSGLAGSNAESQALELHNVSASANGKKQGHSNQEMNEHSRHQAVKYERIRKMEDQLIMAKAYLLFASPNSNSHLVRELRTRIKEREKVLGRVDNDSNLSRMDIQRMRAMDVTLSKANKIYPDCYAMSSKLRAMTLGSEDQLRAQKNEVSFLTQLASRSLPKGLYCLSMRLTAEYFSKNSEELLFPNSHKVRDPSLYHYAIFSDNVLACAVTVNSTISTSVDFMVMLPEDSATFDDCYLEKNNASFVYSGYLISKHQTIVKFQTSGPPLLSGSSHDFDFLVYESEKIVFHVVTDSINFPAVVMWFLLNPPGQAAIHIESLDDFNWLPSGYGSLFKQPGLPDPRYSSALNHLRFYLPKIYPYLNKILFLDHDVIVQRDLRALWRVDMKGKVNAAVERCIEGDSSHRLESLVDCSSSVIAKKFDPNTCIWAYGMNLFDLLEWRSQGLTSVYHKWLQVGRRHQLLKAGSLPLGQLVFYNQTVALDRQWHLLGLGYDPNVGRDKIERVAVIHYNGNMKPWLETGIPEYRGYWSKFLDVNHPYLQECNIHE